MSDKPRARIFLFGAPRVETISGARVEISSKKGIALLATLATADRLERSRTWLQQILWGSRGQKQAQSSLRRELSNLRSVFAKAGLEILRSDQRTVGLEQSGLYIDVLDERFDFSHRQFCEGLDLASEDEFEEWLREMREHYETAEHEHRYTGQAGSAIPEPRSLPAQIGIAPVAFVHEDSAVLSLGSMIGGMLSETLARMRWLPVASMGLTAGSTEPPSRYRLETVILNAGAAASVNFSLLEMPDRIVRWTDTRTIDFADTTSLHSELARIANCVGISFDICEQRHFKVSNDRSPPELGDRNWRIRFHINQFTKDSFEHAKTLIEEAKEQSPENGELLMLQANLELWQHWIERSDQSTSAQLAPLIRAAMRADPADARGPLFYGILDTWHRRSASALTHLNRACELDPSFAQAFVHLGAAHYLSGKPEAAIAPLEHALFLAPLDPKRFFAQGELGTANWMLGRYEECLAIAHNIQTTHPGYVLAHVLETASYAAMGLYDDARRARAKLLDEKPHRYRSMLAWIPFIDRDWARKIRDGVEFDSPPARNLHIVQSS